MKHRAVRVGLTPGLTRRAWFDALEAGHAFMTTGPLVELIVNGAIPGETVSLPEGGGTLDVHGHVRSVTPLAKSHARSQR